VRTTSPRLRAFRNHWLATLGAGNYGADYRMRTFVNLVGLWANANDEVIYFVGTQDVSPSVVRPRPRAEETALVPVLPLEIEKGGVRISLFTVIATFGTAQDVTADELRIESFPADEGTEALLRQAAAPAR